MLETYYLGANTPLGFRSEYDGLQADPRIRRLRILKGGSGCGKSTLMKALARRAEAQGYRTERILCSSDPDSLDGLVIPALRTAVVDGTAPHVVEPSLCGCGANYVNLGSCYREEVLSARADELRAVKAANAACYGPAYAALRAAGAVCGYLRSLTPIPGKTAQSAILGRLRVLCPAEGEGAGFVRRVFLSAVTPKGLPVLPAAGFRTVLLEDPLCQGGPLFSRLAEALRRDGFDLILAMDPMEPEVPAGILAEGCGLAFLRSTPLFPAAEAASDGQEAISFVDRDAPDEAAVKSARSAVGQLRALAGQAVLHLRRAKEYHDRLEALCRPAVDFGKVDRITARLAEEIFEEGSDAAGAGGQEARR